MKKSFATLERNLSTQIEELDEDSDISDSDDEEDSHFQLETTSEGFHFLQLDSESQDSAGVVCGEADEVGTVLQQAFEQRNSDVLFKQNDKKIKLDLRNIILLDSQSTMDLFCNPKFVNKVMKANNKMRLTSNGGSMTVQHEGIDQGLLPKGLV